MIVSTLICSCLLTLFKIAISSEPYKIYNLESDKVCSHNYKYLTKRISTSTDGLIVRETTYFDNLSGKHSFTCRFEVETNSKSQFPGLFAVIQKLHFRKDPVSGECIDYIMLRPVDKDVISEISNINFNLKRNKTPWSKFCGDLRARRDGSLENPASGLAVTGFLSEEEPIEVEVYISNRSPIVNETLELEIVFTPYTKCTNMWSAFKDCGMSKCIKKRAFNDNVVNCPFLNCPDEDGCDISIIEDENLPPGFRTKVTLTAVTSIFCSFFLFLGCIWCCRYFELLCWSASTLLGRPNPLELSPMREPSPSAPTLDQSVNKDLPPAYETLFPDRWKEYGNKDVKS